MPKLDGTGPDGKKAKSGRKLGECSTATEKEKLELLGKGMGQKHHSGGGEGKGKRLKTNHRNT